MTLPVHWVESLAGVRRGDPVEVTGDEAHHAVAVRRIRPGEAVVLTDGRGHRLAGTVTETGKRRLVVTVDDVQAVPEPTPEVTVVQALPKGDRGELAVELLTEIGAGRVVPWAAARSVAVAVWPAAVRTCTHTWSAPASWWARTRSAAVASSPQANRPSISRSLPPSARSSSVKPRRRKLFV